MILVDANIWIYSIDQTAAEHARAKQALARIVEHDEVLLPALVELEVVHYVTRRFAAEGETLLADWFQLPRRTRALDRYLVQVAAHRMRDQRSHGIGSRDAAILSHARQDAALIVTHDAAMLAAARANGQPAWDPITEDDSTLHEWKPRPEVVIRERAHRAKAKR